MDLNSQIFIFGFKDVRRNKCHLIGFIIAQATMEEKNKTAQNTDCDRTGIFSRLTESRIMIDFNFHKSVKRRPAGFVRCCDHFSPELYQ